MFLCMLIQQNISIFHKKYYELNFGLLWWPQNSRSVWRSGTNTPTIDICISNNRFLGMLIQKTMLIFKKKLSHLSLGLHKWPLEPKIKTWRIKTYLCPAMGFCAGWFNKLYLFYIRNILTLILDSFNDL